MVTRFLATNQFLKKNYKRRNSIKPLIRTLQEQDHAVGHNSITDF
jgi:hypothetical protein